MEGSGHDWWAMAFLAFGFGVAIWEFVRNRLRRKRVPLAGFENWPRVYRTGGTDDAPAILLEARYASPRTMKAAKGWARLAAVMFGVWVSDRLTHPVLGPDSEWFQQNAGPLIVAALIGWASFYGWRALFRRTLWRVSLSPLRMTFQGGGIEWKGEAQHRKWFGFGGAARVKPGEKWNPETKEHRLAAEERRVAEERRQRRRKTELYYQQCSEVLIFAGPGLPRTLSVAELAEDEHGEKARALVAAILAAHGLALGLGRDLGLVTEDAAETVEEPAALSSPGSRRRGLRR
jgi:hypothetical protein